MKLKDYLEEEKLSVSGFCRKLNLCEATVSKWKYNDVIPRKEDVLLIYKFTKGKVTPNDFYGIKK